DDTRPVIVAFDASPPAEAAVRAAASLFADRQLLVVSVWEPGLALAVMSYPDTTGMSYGTPTSEDIAMVDRAQRTHAEAAAEAGARMARDLGATAQALSVPDSADTAETLAAVAQQHSAAAVVVGSRGLGDVKSKLLGSTSRRLMHRTHLPVLVVRVDPAADDQPTTSADSR
ncbi:MAG TPA: universal stress protein, partial [Solirubrobacteraceae bacterium]